MNQASFPPNVETGPRFRYTNNAITAYVLISFLLFLLCFFLVRFPDQLSRPVVRWMNSFSWNNRFIDNVLNNLSFSFTFSGVLLCGILLSYWLSSRDFELKARILVGICASFGAGIISRFLQHQLSTNVRPYYDKAVDFHPPPGMHIQPWNMWNSFPSDHATVYAGLVVVFFVAKSRIRYAIAVWIAIVESCRILIGGHFPLDLIGGACLASAVVWTFQYPLFVRFGEWCCIWEFRSPKIFYTLYFILLYQVATLFIEIREMVGGFNAIRTLTGG